jgi:hypothetical protein
VNVCIAAMKNMPNRPCLSKKKYFIAPATELAIHQAKAIVCKNHLPRVLSR